MIAGGCWTRNPEYERRFYATIQTYIEEVEEESNLHILLQPRNLAIMETILPLRERSGGGKPRAMRGHRITAKYSKNS
jgi:hypothetical protein